MEERMNGKDIILATLAASPKAGMGPVQIQKSLFLIDRRIPKLIGGPFFSFRAYHYGPFDAAIYRLLEDLESEGTIRIDREANLRRNSYVLTPEGLARGRNSLATMTPPAAAFVEKVAHFVTTLSFSELVSSIYREYPDMKANSVFA
jgi:DNA-binding PadR family transcriptional regulator